MTTLRRTIFLAITAVAACAPTPERAPERAPEQRRAPARIVSLDYCADQYVLKLADREDILALSPDAGANFSYMRAAAEGLPRVRARAEDILLLRPDLVVRTYGGGPGALAYFERLDVPVLQIPYAADLEAAENAIVVAAEGLGVRKKGDALIEELRTRRPERPERHSPPRALYLTSKGAAAGKGTTIDDLFSLAGLTNFAPYDGWSAAPLEMLAHGRPDLIAAGFFDGRDLDTDWWTPARHPVAQRALAKSAVVQIPGAWTACGAWPLYDALDALSDAATEMTAAP